MSTSEEIKNELHALLDEQKNLTELASDRQNYIKFGTTYQIWYASVPSSFKLQVIRI